MITTSESQFTYQLDVYGITVTISSTDPETAEHLAEDFAHFRVENAGNTPKLRVHLVQSKPPYEDVPDRPATIYTPRNVSFRHQGLTFIDYSGRALGVHNSREGALDVFSEDIELLYEAGYLFLLSQLGELLDKRGLHRVHAAAFSVRDRGALLLLPMGGGKSTLTMHILQNPEVQFLSDDSPLIDRHGMLHAFPLRIGILPGSESVYQPSQLRTIQRMEFGPKLLLRYGLFEKRIVPRATPDFIFIGRRSLGTACVIQPATRIAALRALIPNCVVGLGLFQGMEFIFNHDNGEILMKVAATFSRLRNCISLVRRSSAYTVILGRDLRQNAVTIRAFLERHSV